MHTNQQAVLVFTDLVDSVKLQKLVGAAAYAKLKALHDGLLQAILASVPEAEIVESTGDGYYLRFPTCSSAVEACLLFQHALAVDKSADYPLEVRIGIHSGEVSRADRVSNPLLGLAPSITARVMSLALPRQILLTQPVYQDAAQYVRQHPRVPGDRQPSLCWANHGLFQMKGEDAPTAIYEVGAVGIAPLRTPPNNEKARQIPRKNTAVEASPPRRLAPVGAFVAVLLAFVAGWLLWMRDTPSTSTGPVAVATPQPPTTIDLETPVAPPGDTPETSTGQKNFEPPPRVQAPADEEAPAANKEDNRPYDAKKEPHVEQIPPKETIRPRPPVPDPADKVSPEPPRQKYTIELVRLLCNETNDLDDEDQIQMELKVDDNPVKFRYPNNYQGTPCVNLSAGEAWKIGIRLTFENKVTADFRELGGIPGQIGRTVVTPETIEQGITSTDMKRGGLARQNYRIEWRVVSP